MITLPGKVQQASPGWLGFDTDTKISPEHATQLYNYVGLTQLNS